MRIASCNILHGIDIRRLSGPGAPLPPNAIDLEAVATWIDSLGADVVALQEVDHLLMRSGERDQVAWLADRLGMEGVFAPALAGSPDDAWDEAAPGVVEPAYGVGLLSRVGLDDVVRHRLPFGGAGTREAGASPVNPGRDREPRVTLSVTVGEDLRVTTTHLSYMFWWAVPQLGRALRAATAGHDGPGILVGDVNLPMWGGWLALHARGLNPWRWPEAATRAAGWRYLPGEATYPSWKPRVQLDQVFVRHMPDGVRVSVGPAGPSDHLPLLVDC